MTNPSFRCVFCGGQHCAIKYSFESVETQIVQCKKCDLMVLSPLPSHEDLLKVYDENYFSNADLVGRDIRAIYGYSDYISERYNKQKAYSGICRRITQFLKFGKGYRPRLMDYGCGLGHFIDAAYDFGFSVEGVEFNPYAIEYIRRRYTYPILHSSAWERRHPREGLYDVITLFDVIEHLRDPLQLIRAAAQSLKPGGLIVISTMDSRSLTSRLLGKRLEDFRRIREHLFFFSKSNLTRILATHGFETLHVETLGHTFEVKHLVARINATFPVIGAIPHLALKVLPVLGRMNVYINPRTKIILYARKKA